MRLQYRITLFIVAILLIAGIVGPLLSLYLQQRNAISQFEESAQTMAGTLLGSLEHAMLEAEREHIQEVVADIASEEPVNEVVILSATQKVYASGNSSEIGETRNDKETAQALASGETVTRTKKQ
jgi:sensor histidine kinase regulating citrate/malate metabolism